MKKVRFLRPAELKLLDAAHYYELQATALGSEFLDKIDSAIQEICKYPEHWPVVKADIRRRLVHRFPYALLYRIDPEEIVIQATMHLHRRPDYWLER